MQRLGGNFGSSTIDFGSSFTDSGSVAVTGLSFISTTSPVRAWIQDDSTSDSTASEHELLAQDSAVVVSSRLAGIGFTVSVYLSGSLAKGTFTVRWVY